MSTIVESESRAFWRYALLTSSAIILAYMIGEYFKLLDGVIAAVTAGISVQTTFHHSVKEVVWQATGLCVGVMLGLAASLWLPGFDALVLGIAVVGGFILARTLRVSTSSALSVVVPIILVVGAPNFNVAKLETRALSVLVGGVIGILISLLIKPGTPASRVLEETSRNAEHVADVMEEVAQVLPSEQITMEQTREWLAKLREVNQSLEALREEAEDALVSVRWSPLLKRGELESVVEQVSITQETATTVTDMIRDLYLSYVKQRSMDSPPLPSHMAESLATVLDQTAEMIADQAAAAVLGKPAAPADPEVVAAAAAAREETLEKVKHAESPTSFIVGAGLIRDSEKIETILTAVDEEEEETLGHS